MNTSAARSADTIGTIVTKRDPSLPAFLATAAAVLAIRAGTIVDVDGRTFTFDVDTAIGFEPPAPGQDCFVVLGDDGALTAHPVATIADLERPGVLGGFHFAPGGCAVARAGGDETPAINPHSLWDVGYRPACADPRGMAYVARSPGAPHVPGFWCDVYLLAQDHRDGTSRFGVTIADGDNLPTPADGTEGNVKRCDWPTVTAILERHGKGLLSIDEFFAAAYGVVEREAAVDRVEQTALDARRTSRFGLMQAVGQRSTWGHDGDPDERRACWFGGGWIFGGWAGSRVAVVEHWPDGSGGWLGARGRSDHLQLG